MLTEFARATRPRSHNAPMPTSPAGSSRRAAACLATGADRVPPRRSRRPTTSSRSTRSSSPARAAPRAHSTCRRRVDIIDGHTLREGQPQINLSESLVARAGHLRRQPQQLRAGPADQLARLRRARARSACAACGSTRTASRSPMPDGQGQTGSFSLLSARAHRGRARAVLDALRQRVGRRDRGVHRGSAPDPPVGTVHRRRRQLRRMDAGVKLSGGRAERGRASPPPVISQTDGFREHSAARRELTNAEARFRAAQRHAHHAHRQHAVPARDAGPARL